ncbi:hypothetical protein [Aeromicrobium sp. YIM 150415]|uniref:hypothetical protein n=1 Tax=Aeromicrobium sp. YIM 150415 TaxID=2803912 RepID=UPI001F06740C|nr:hypothetical protein [Aeromicrobium sp. YIM 150415]
MRYGLKWLAAGAAGCVVLAACSGGGDSGPSGDGVEAGADLETYQEAFADVEPVTLSFQLAVGSESLVAAPVQRYAEAVEEWSDGKIEIELLYSGSRVALQEMTSALAEGLVDMGHHVTTYEADTYPVTSLGADLLFLQEPTPVVGTLQLTAAWAEAGAVPGPFKDELIENGIQPLVPFAPNQGSGLLCRGEPVRSLDDARGKVIRAGSEGQAGELEALGATPVTLPLLEVYDGLQRGVVDCVIASLAMAEGGGFIEAGDSWTLDDRFGFSTYPSGVSIGLDRWESLPLVAQQLLWDRLDVFLEETVASTAGFEMFSTALETSTASGVTIETASDDLAQAVNGYFDEARDRYAEADLPTADAADIVDDVVETHEKWLGIVQELGYEDEVGWADAQTWFAENEVDLEAYVDRLRSEILDPNRPE